MPGFPLAVCGSDVRPHVALVSAERSAGLRTPLRKHTKSVPLDSVLLAQSRMLQPKGCTPNWARTGPRYVEHPVALHAGQAGA